MLLPGETSTTSWIEIATIFPVHSLRYLNMQSSFQCLWHYLHSGQPITDIVWQRNSFMDQQIGLLEHVHPVFGTLFAARMADSRSSSADHSAAEWKRWRAPAQIAHALPHLINEEGKTSYKISTYRMHPVTGSCTLFFFLFLSLSFFPLVVLVFPFLYFSCVSLPNLRPVNIEKKKKTKKKNNRTELSTFRLICCHERPTTNRKKIPTLPEPWCIFIWLWTQFLSFFSFWNDAAAMCVCVCIFFFFRKKENEFCISMSHSWRWQGAPHNTRWSSSQVCADLQESISFMLIQQASSSSDTNSGARSMTRWWMSEREMYIICYSSLRCSLALTSPAGRALHDWTPPFRPVLFGRDRQERSPSFGDLVSTIAVSKRTWSTTVGSCWHRTHCWYPHCVISAPTHTVYALLLVYSGYQIISSVSQNS